MLDFYYLSDLSFMCFALLPWIDVLISHHVVIPCQISERTAGPGSTLQLLFTISAL